MSSRGDRPCATCAHRIKWNKMDAGFPWKSDWSTDKKQPFGSSHSGVTCGLNLDGSRTVDFWNAERWLCPKHSEVTLQLQTGLFF